jgi:hypothetical protein
MKNLERSKEESKKTERQSNSSKMGAQENKSYLTTS